MAENTAALPSTKADITDTAFLVYLSIGCCPKSTAIADPITL
jgi:hypothetical protein